MFKRKLRILFASEGSFTNTGFASYYRELITRLHATGKYRIAEHAAFVPINDPGDSMVKWRLYANDVPPNDPRHKELNSNTTNKLGAWRFNQVCLDFQPDIVVDLRDPHMFGHEHLTYLRRFYNWIIAPTVDSEPQHDSWLNMFCDADQVYPYTEFGLDVLHRSHPQINAPCAMYPGVNLNTYKPLDKKQVREKYNIDPNIELVGFVARNQGRKLFPDLIKTFKKYLDNTNKKNSYLYLHTCHPDIQPWNIPRLLLEYDLHHRVIFSYMCTQCNHNFCNLWQGPITTCKKCLKDTAIHPNVAHGLTTSQMREIYNLFDLYVQYANCEGLGMPLLEAAACGVPTMAINHTAMSDIVRLTGGTPLEPLKIIRDMNMDAERAVSDNDLGAKEIERFFNLPEDMRDKKGARARKKTEENFNWDKISKKWEEIFDNTKLTGYQGKWCYVDNPKVPMDKNIEYTPKTYINGRLDAMGLGHMKSLHFVNDLAQNLYFGSKGIRNGVSKNDVDNVLNALETTYMQIQNILSGNDQLVQEDYLNYAIVKEVVNIE